ncbi:nicotinamidase/pyrazinamidase [Catalinimonas alkaloidigena]|uniref:Nicotinamidase n=1 Tax=Catalinimonas alkaloidigena TaxID=1075417 RepID=A0A1G9BP87_9BACT|nr:bifunctional nicotinamidase/pyrazinamidase [Catalinimonas alkaloidigena]SDK41321.1 nicotinamidase/pyrazinamidase [Catalinimonas alkaloidigena]
MKKALIIVDIQYDFLPGGALAVTKGDQVISIINRLQPHFDLVVATQDWHPADHGSFAANHADKHPGEVIDLHGLSQVLWPVHCVQHSEGAALAQELDQEPIQEVFQKGTDPTIDSYSGFYDNGHRKATGLTDYLKSKGVTDLYLTGLAADYCVKFTALDAVRDGFKAHLITDATRGVNLQPDDTEKALAELKAKGVELLTSHDVLAQMA